MQNTINSVLQNPAARALILIVLIIPLSVYLGTSPVRRGFLYDSGLFAPSVVAAIVTGLWTWSWKSFWLMLVACSALTLLIQAFVYLLGLTRFSTPPPLRCRGAEAPRVAKRTRKPERRDAVQLRDQLGAQARELLIGDRS